MRIPFFALKLTFLFLLITISCFGKSPALDTILNRLERAKLIETKDSDRAIALMENTLDFAINKKEKYGEWETHEAIGFYYSDKNQLDKALDAFQKNVSIAKELDSLKLEGLGLLHVGNLYVKLGKANEAKPFISEALSIFQTTNSRKNEARAMMNLGNVNTMIGNNDEALEYYLSAYDLLEELGEEDMLSGLNLNIGFFYLMNGQGEAALPYAISALDNFLAEGDPKQIAKSYGNLAYAYSLIGDYTNAFQNYQHSVDTARKYDFTQVEFITYKDMSDTYKQSGNMAKAMEYQTKYYALRDSVISQEAQDRVNELQVQFEAAEQTSQIKELKQQQQIKNLQLILLVIGIAIVGFISWFIIQKQRGDIKEKQGIISKNEKIHLLEKELIEKELQQKALEQEKIAAEAIILKQQEEEARRYAQTLEGSNKELEQFAHVVSHDLREPLRMVRSYLGLIKRRLDKETLAKTQDYFHYAIDGADRMDKLIRSILNLAKVQQEELELQPVDLNNTVYATIQNLHEFIEEKNAQVNYETLPEIKGDMLQISQLVQNLINNGLKYNESEVPTVNINHKIVGDYIEIRFEDNGIGIAEEQQERVFQMFQRLEGRKYSGTGIGLATCKKIVERHRGSIDLTSEKGVGTTFTVKLPIK